MEDNFLYDVRIRERHLKKGLLTPETVKKHLDALVDLEAQAETVTLEQPAVVGHGDGSR